MATKYSYDRTGAGPRPRALQDLERDAKRVYKDLTGLIPTMTKLQLDIPGDELEKVFKLVTKAQQALDDANDAISRL